MFQLDFIPHFVVFVTASGQVWAHRDARRRACEARVNDGRARGRCAYRMAHALQSRRAIVPSFASTTRAATHPRRLLLKCARAARTACYGCPRVQRHGSNIRGLAYCARTDLVASMDSSGILEMWQVLPTVCPRRCSLVIAFLRMRTRVCVCVCVCVCSLDSRARTRPTCLRGSTRCGTCA